MSTELTKTAFPPRDLTKYPNPEDEPLEVQCARMGIRQPKDGESMLEWGQSGPFLPTSDSSTTN